MSKYHVTYITDDNYAMPTAVSIVSLLENKLPNVEYVIHVLVDNVSDENKDKLKQITYPNCEIDIVEADSSFYEDFKGGQLNKATHVKPTALLKFNIPNMFKDVQKMLYLDSDIIITKDISDLFTMDISNYCVATVRAMGMFVHHLDPNLKYFASSMMLFNLDNMRAENMVEKLIDYKKNKITNVMDNDAFCVVLDGRDLFLPYEYNFNTWIFSTRKFEDFNQQFFNGKYADECECLEDQRILHMQGKQKPWQYWFPWLTDLFVKYYNLSPYKESPLQIKNSSTSIIIKKIMHMDNKKDWRFPREKISKGSRIILYGAGEVGRSFYNFLKDTDYAKVVLWVDNNFDKVNDELGENLVSPSSDIKSFSDYDYVLITFFREAMSIVTSMQLKKFGVPEDKIVTI